MKPTTQNILCKINFYQNQENLLRSLLITFLILFLIENNCLSCDFSQPDKIKHIQVSKKATLISTKIYSIPFLPLKPVKWLFNPTVQKIFPDNYIPHAFAAGTIFTGSTLKEVTYDLIMPNHYADYCDVQANCIGIKEGLKNQFESSSLSIGIEK